MRLYKGRVPVLESRKIYTFCKSSKSVYWNLEGLLTAMLVTAGATHKGFKAEFYEGMCFKLLCRSIHWSFHFTMPLAATLLSLTFF